MLLLILIKNVFVLYMLRPYQGVLAHIKEIISGKYPGAWLIRGTCHISNAILSLMN